MGKRATQVIVAAVLLVALGMYAWHFFNPGPMAFAGGSTVALSDYHGADPTEEKNDENPVSIRPAADEVDNRQRLQQKSPAVEEEEERSHGRGKYNTPPSLPSLPLKTLNTGYTEDHRVEPRSGGFAVSYLCKNIGCSHSLSRSLPQFPTPSPNPFG